MDVRGPLPSVGACDRGSFKDRGLGDLGEAGEPLTLQRWPATTAGQSRRERVDRGVPAHPVVTLTREGNACQALLAYAPSITSSAIRPEKCLITMSASTRPSSGCEGLLS